MTDQEPAIQSPIPDLTGMTLDQIAAFYRAHKDNLDDATQGEGVKTETQCSSLTPF